jgi:Flp pilus assembly protein TadB
MDWLVAHVMILVVSALVAATAVIAATVIIWINKSARKTRNRK